MSRQYTRSSPPPGDADSDALVGLFDEMIGRRMGQGAILLGTITNVRGDDAQVSVQRWDEDASGQQFRARLAGTDFRNGDQVVMAPVGGGEYVVLGKLANSNADKAVIGPSELRPRAVRASHIEDRSIPPVKLSEQYPTHSQASDTASEIASDLDQVLAANFQAKINALQAQINDLKNNPSGVTMAQVNDRIDARVNSGNTQSGPYLAHKHDSGWIRVDTKDASNLTTVLLELRALAVCAYQNRNKTGNPCASRVTRLKQLL